MIPRKPKELCVNCKWHSLETHVMSNQRIFTSTRTTEKKHICKWQDFKWDFVTGDKVWSGPRNEDCYHARDPEDGFCRPEALYFIPKA